MLLASYAIWGGALAVVLILLLGVWIAGLIARYRAMQRSCGIDTEAVAFSIGDQSHHQTHVSLMNQKTDAMLVSLARSIEQERRKLAGMAGHASTEETTDGCQTPAASPENVRQSRYSRIMPLVDEGVEIPSIARQLNLSEAEVVLAMRMHAA